MKNFVELTDEAYANTTAHIEGFEKHVAITGLWYGLNIVNEYVNDRCNAIMENLANEDFAIPRVGELTELRTKIREVLEQLLKKEAEMIGSEIHDMKKEVEA